MSFQNPYIEVLSLCTSERDYIWRSCLQRGSYVKMRPWGRALIKLDRCPYKNRRFWHTGRYQRCSHTEERPCGDPDERQPCASQGERPLEKAKLPAPCSWTSDFRTVRNKLVSCTPPSLWHCVMAILANEYNARHRTLWWRVTCIPTYHEAWPP